MTLNQEFGDKPLVPTGISGDYGEGFENRIHTETRQNLGRQAYYAELANRYENGLLTPTEETELMNHFSADVAQGYN